MENPCSNCGHNLSNHFAFCPYCGQNTKLGRLRLRDIFNEAVQYFTDVDKGIFRLLLDLATRPGIIAREYIDGKRKKHFSPLNFYLIVGTLMILVMSMMPASEPAKSASTAVKEAHKSERVKAIDLRKEKSSLFWQKYSDFVAIAAAPLLCLIYWLFFRKTGYNYTEHLVACLYMFGFTNLVYAVIITPAGELMKASGVGTTLLLFGVFKTFEVIYTTIFYYQLTKPRLRYPLLSAAGVSILAVFFWGALTTSLMFLYISDGFWGLLD